MTRTVAKLLAGRYRLGALVGEGAMSTVSRASDELLDRPVALKLLKPAFAGDEEFVARLYGEARAAAKIVHPNVVGVYDILSEGPLHAIVMEYVPGGSLAAVLRGGPVRQAQAVRYARQIAQALAAAHAQGVIHRDIKPANVLLTGPGDVKVADFGLAKAMENSGATYTQVGQMLGSVHYFSPEQAQGKTLTPASDLYSLGIVLYELLSGRVPFQSESPLGTALAHVNEASPRAADLHAFMSPDLAIVVARLLQKDPAKRYADASELDRALAPFDTESPAQATLDSPTIIAPGPPAARSGRSNVGGVAGGAAVAAAAYLDQFWGWTRANSAPIEAGLRSVAPRLGDLRRGSSSPKPATIAMGALVAALVLGSMAALWHPRVALADLRATRADAAQARLRSAGLEPVVQPRPDERVPPGSVIAQVPGPGTALHRGDRVSLVVSSGPPTVQIPNVLGHSLLYASKVMGRFKLRPSYAARISDVPANTIMEEVPAAGTVVREYSRALIIVSAGPAPRMIYSGDGGD